MTTETRRKVVSPARDKPTERRRAQGARVTSAPEGETTSERVLRIARTIIDETGDFELPMRELAARTQVSLKTPYLLFGSKAGLIDALLQEDFAVFLAEIAQDRPDDPIERMFRNLNRAGEFYERRQPFYRALFRATQGYVGSKTEPSRALVAGLEGMLARAQAMGMIRKRVDIDLVGEACTNVFAGEIRFWAAQAFHIRFALLRVAFGWSLLLAGAATSSSVKDMRERVAALQAQVQGFNDEA